MIEPKIYYKVCKQSSIYNQETDRYEWEYISYSLSKRGKYTLIYKPNQWTYPKLSGSKIFVFGTSQDARLFNRDNGTIWEVQATDVTPLTQITRYYECDEWIEKFWSPEVDTVDEGIYKSSAPVGSFGASAVKLIKIYGE